MFKNFFKKLVYGHKATSDSFVRYLRSLGMVIGDEVHFYAPMKCIVDTQHPWMVEIGNNVHITEGVTLLTHGYDWAVLKGKYGDVLGSAGHIFIGNNVFIGMNATVLKGVRIGNDVVIGANAVLMAALLREIRLALFVLLMNTWKSDVLHSLVRLLNYTGVGAATPRRGKRGTSLLRSYFASFSFFSRIVVRLTFPAKNTRM